MTIVPITRRESACCCDDPKCACTCGCEPGPCCGQCSNCGCCD